MFDSRRLGTPTRRLARSAAKRSTFRASRRRAPRSSNSRSPAPGRADVLDSRRIAFVAQQDRPAPERATLVLIGVEFKQPVAHGEMVSEVHTRPFCGRGSREDYDGGL